MNVLEVMHEYFRGERIEAAYFILPASLLLFAMGATAIYAERGSFRWAVGIPSVLFGVVGIVTGLTVALRTAGQVAELEQLLASDPAAMLAAEMPRMEAVMRNFRIYLGAFGVIAAVGVAIRFGVKAEWALGLGPALVVIGGVGLLIDGFAERRAQPYVAALESLAAAHGTSLEERGG